MKDLTLVIMAAGMGSRYGGLKQIEPVGPNGEFIIDYSIYDAIQAGFNKVIFIIKEENYEIFKSTIGVRVESKIKVEYVFQDMKKLPGGIKCPKERVKPWGTVHAILAAKDVVKEPFAVINADDYYGRDAYLKASEFLLKDNNNEYAMIGYMAGNTLSENGSVKRGVCKSENEYLVNVTESVIQKEEDKISVIPFDKTIDKFYIDDETLVSMNFFLFQPDIFIGLEKELEDHLNNNNLETCEYLIAEYIMEQIVKNNLKVKIIKTNSPWHGITYLEDKEKIIDAIGEYIDSGIIKSKLWE